jgi:hypothetical protein
VSVCSKWLNAIGLVFGIIGVVLIFIWGPPQPSFERGAALGLEDNTKLSNGKTVAQNNADIAAREERYKIMSRIGLVLIGLSFALQLWGVWM